MADLTLQTWRIGAMRLLKLADAEAARDPLIAAAHYAKAADALLNLPDETTALTAVSTGLELAQEAAELHMLKGKIHLSKRDWALAEQALTKAESLNRFESAGFAYRARARLEQGKVEPAALDTIAALRLDPHNIEALVLRGELIQQGLTMDMPTPTISGSTAPADPASRPAPSKPKPGLRGLR